VDEYFIECVEEVHAYVAGLAELTPAGRAALLPAFEAWLAQHGEALRQDPARRLEHEGHVFRVEWTFFDQHFRVIHFYVSDEHAGMGVLRVVFAHLDPHGQPFNW
jgi:hypothetical protein